MKIGRKKSMDIRLETPSLSHDQQVLYIELDSTLISALTKYSFFNTNLSNKVIIRLVMYLNNLQCFIIDHYMSLNLLSSIFTTFVPLKIDDLIRE